ncbi:MAG TPA: BamA/TamA family outer membrane protein [Saprospiraceae bacterium]|nr:BamA/TamA family outer membrane protein [Saprospiraceae bacterium]
MKLCKFIILLLGISHISCSITKYIPEGERVYTGHTLSVQSSEKISNQKLIAGEIRQSIRPQVKKSVFGFNPGLWLWYRHEQEKLNFFTKFFYKRMAIEPIYLSDVNPEKNLQTSEIIVENSGFFESKGSYEIEEQKNKRVRLSYLIQLNKAYTLNHYSYEGGETRLDSFIRFSLKESLLQKSQAYQLGRLVEERERISSKLQEEGFFNFIPSFLIFSMDTTIAGDHLFDLYLRLKDDISPEALQSYKLGEVYVQFIQSLADDGNPFQDTTTINGISIIGSQKLFRPEFLEPLISLKNGEIYKKSNSDRTRQRLFATGNFGFVNLRMNETGLSVADSSEFRNLDTHIQLYTLTRHSLRSELQAISKSNNFMGPLFTGEYRNRNTFRGGEIFSMSLRLGYETQIAGGRQTGLSAFEAGIFTELSIPRIIGPVQWGNKVKYGVPRTKMNLSINILDRVQFYRLQSSVLGFGYTWSSSRYSFHDIKPIALTLTRLIKSSETFREILDNNFFLQRSFEQQFIPGFEYSYTYNELWNKTKTNHTFFTIRTDLAGNLLNSLQKISSPASEGNFIGTEYARYARIDFDMRRYINAGKESRLIARVFTGFGAPIGHSLSLPYIKQYFSGGPNSIRAFRIRSLGPGTYRPEILDAGSFFDQAGDIRMEANVEYRYPMYKNLKGALFVDAGNIWLFNENPSLPGAAISSSWYKELALGVGIGFRIDFDFFVLRLDLATPLRKPWFPEGERWVTDFQPGLKEWRRENLIWNIAIGYPF